MERTGQGGESVEYIDLDWPTGVPGGGASAPLPEPTAPMEATPTPTPARRPQGRGEQLVFPGQVPQGIPAPAAGAGAGVGTEGGAGEGGRAAPDGGGGIGERLGPGFRDPRLYVDPRTEALTKTDTRTDHQKYMEHLQARINASNDSAAGITRRADTDWTFKDKDGRRWGVSEKGIHLGGITVPRALVPMPGATGSNQKQEAAREEQRQRDEIRRQEEGRSRREGQDEAIQETRERKDAERKEGKGDG